MTDSDAAAFPASQFHARSAGAMTSVLTILSVSLAAAVCALALTLAPPLPADARAKPPHGTRTSDPALATPSQPTTKGA